MDQTDIFKLTRNVMGNSSNVNLPKLTSAELLVNKLSIFLLTKRTLSRVMFDSRNNICDITIDQDLIFRASSFD